jgi:transposase
MKYVGIDIGSSQHAVATVDELQQTLLKPTFCAENAEGYARLGSLLPPAHETLIAMEATGHYWQNLFTFLSDRGYSVALLNPLRTRRFAEEEMRRAKTDRVDALQIARFAAQKRPAATSLPDELSAELRQLVNMRERLVQDFGDRVRQLHRLVDLTCPELTELLSDLGSAKATGILEQFPTGAALRSASVRQLSKLRYDGQHKVGPELARSLVELAQRSVGAHHGQAYALEVRFLCEDLIRWRERLNRIEDDLQQTLSRHKVGQLLTSIDGIGPLTSARIVATVGNPALAFRSASAFASYVGSVPATELSGKSRRRHFSISPLGNAQLRRALWMPTLRAVRSNPWLRSFYERLRAEGKPFKVAVVAAMRKLLHAVYSVAKHLQPFTPHLPAQEVTSGS